MPMLFYVPPMAPVMSQKNGTAVENVSDNLFHDIDEARVRDASIAIDQPFFWAPDPANPFLRLELTNASLTRDELRFGATGRLRTAQGAGVDVAFEEIDEEADALLRERAWREFGAALFEEGDPRVARLKDLGVDGPILLPREDDLPFLARPLSRQERSRAEEPEPEAA